MNNLSVIITDLLSHDADINAKDYKERTALHLASKHSNHGIRELLISNGIDADAKDIYGKTALQL
ncbi:hypothetical protein TVAG_504100 [Trichomonas vaginalis G3]|nr:Ankyrin repeat family [Trichomonas vaginalis G3]XP_051103707.1 Ankyrin repeat family [Trichomonas vaginalis G3]EAX77755.1 hypothetical protein TVAG_577430 [Trichomonas vaginalis G3]EAX81698.1 hypothetical protein TVAG_504100 [Trichomonas vaginalis G3]KAI5535808.1 Ankyrin repeat family [Trichomonas vaginalis G3]KAI5537067.1 Ankyrin repeat family [Trichomonas vaginalis G3]|eukprot:XP_001290685.1 hypothetical protein [Trichomonas vaginalis G3]